MKKTKLNKNLNTLLLAFALAVSLVPVYILMGDKESLKYLLVPGNGVSTVSPLSSFLFIYALIGGAGIGNYFAGLNAKSSTEIKVAIFVGSFLITSLILYVVYILAGLSNWST